MKKNSKNSILIIFSFLILPLMLSLVFFNMIDDNIMTNNTEFHGDQNLDEPQSSLAYLWNETWYSALATYRGRGVALDSFGNVYVAGEELGGNADIFLTKFNSSGEYEWSRTWDGILSSFDYGYDVAVDNQNNVYVAGRVSNRGAMVYDSIVIKYNSSGDYEWNRTWSWAAPVNFKAEAHTIKVDSSDNIYVAGDTYNTTSREMMVIKYNSTGDLKWNVTFDTDNTDYNNKVMCRDMVLDPGNNIYLVGYNDSGITENDVVIVKLDSTGNHIWNRTININPNDLGYGIDIDSNNVTYIVGSTYTTSETLLILKYDSDGNQLFSDYPIAYSSAQGVVVDKILGDFYVAGSDTDDNDVFLYKFNNSGSSITNYTWDSGANDNGYDLAYDPSGAIYISGEAFNTTRTYADLLLLKYTLIPSTFSLNATASDPDPDGNFYLNWTQSNDADNYTVYNSSSYITEINGTLDIVAKDITNQSLMISGLSNGTYYYIVESHNFYGNSTSNVKQVNIGLVPGTFDLSENSTKPFDSDGIFGLNWTISQNAKNYSIYYLDTEINQTSLASATEFQSGITGNQVTVDFSSIANGIWYVSVVAYNDYGSTIANKNVTVKIGLPPGAFTLSSDAGNPDSDGQIKLSWTEAATAVSYKVYISTTPITNVNDPGVDLLYTGSDRSYTITEASALSTGTYYVRVVASNAYGSTPNTADLTITVDRQLDDLPWWLRAVITGAISASVGVAIKIAYSARKKRKLLYERISEKFDQIDNIEEYLKQNLDFEEWNKLKEPILKYNSKEITYKQLIKQGKKDVGDKFIGIFTKAKTGKTVAPLAAAKTKKPVSKPSVPKESSPEIKGIEEKIKNIDNVKHKLEMNFEIGDIDESEYKTKMKHLNEKKADLTSKLNDLKK